MTLWKSSQLNLPYLISRRNVINIETCFSSLYDNFTIFLGLYGMPIWTIRIIGRQASNEINILREKRNRSPNSFSARKDIVRNRGRNNARRKRGRWCNFCPRVLNIRAKLFCKSKLAARKSGWTSAFLWPSRHGPGVKLLLVAASLLALMLPRETVYISCTKARMSVMPRPI